MNVQSFPVDQLHANPWQTRTEDDVEHIQRLAEDIKANGLLQVPLGRQNGSGLQLAFGHSRLAAWKIAFPGEPMPVDVRELTDRQLSDFAAAENGQRKNLTAIETARAIQRRIVDFKLTQLEAARPFGITSQGGVSNILRLLKLPEPIQAQVQSGEMSERVARRLLPVARVADAAVTKIAEAALKLPVEEREEAIVEKFDELLRKTGKSLNGVAWDLSWPKEPMSAEKVAEPRAGEPADLKIPSCTACEYFVEADRSAWCTRSICFTLKARLFALTEAEKISKATGIALQPRLGGGAVYRLGQNSQSVDWAKRVMGLKKAASLLRLMPLDDGSKNWSVKDITGSYVVAVGTIDLVALKAATKTKASKEDADEHVDGESESARREKERNKDAKANRDRSRAEAEQDRLIAAATAQFAGALPKGELLDLLFGVANVPVLAEDYLSFDGGRYFGDRAGDRKRPEQEKQIGVMAWLLDEQMQMSSSTLNKIHQALEETARGLKVKLPKDWDSLERYTYPQVENRCWDCGCTSSEYGARELGPTDLARGWSVREGEDTPVHVRCPECWEKRVDAMLKSGEFKPISGSLAKKKRKAKKK